MTRELHSRQKLATVEPEPGAVGVMHNPFNTPMG